MRRESGKKIIFGTRMQNNSKKIIAVLQARLTSARLPAKVLADISGKPMLWHIVKRLEASKLLDETVLAVPDTKENDKLEDFAKEYKIKYIRGNESDVLSRICQAAKMLEADVVLRALGDSPLVDPDVIDFALQSHIDSKADYSTTHLYKKIPLGLDPEIINFDVLQKLDSMDVSQEDREHVTSYLYRHEELFKINKVDMENFPLSFSQRFTVDAKEDLELVREIYKALYKEGKIFKSADVAQFLQNNPDLMKINLNIKQKELSR